VMIQVLVAMIAYLLLRLIKNTYPVGKLSLQDISRLVSTNIFHRKSISELAGMAFRKVKPDKTNINQQLEMLCA